MQYYINGNLKFRPLTTQVRFYADYRIKPHVPPLRKFPPILLSFNLATILPRRSICALTSNSQNLNTHCLQHELVGCLILFDHHAFMIQCHFLLVINLQKWKSLQTYSILSLIYSNKQLNKKSNKKVLYTNPVICFSYV